MKTNSLPKKINLLLSLKAVKVKALIFSFLGDFFLAGGWIITSMPCLSHLAETFFWGRKTIKQPTNQ